MTEWIVIVLLTCAPAFWMIGGFKWKWVRRFLWPITAVVCLLVAGVIVNRCLLMGSSMVVVNTMPYGDRTPWFVRCAVFSLYAIPALFLSPETLYLTVPMCAVLLTALMVVSRRFNWITWKVWEAEAGLLQASSIIFGVLRG